jgi:acyl-coenzyme A thioesterase PaaI-like protein
MQAIWDFFQNDRFAQHSGFELLEIGAGRARARMGITDAHRNGMDLAHGGATGHVVCRGRGDLAPPQAGLVRAQGDP